MWKGGFLDSLIPFHEYSPFNKLLWHKLDFATDFEDVTQVTNHVVLMFNFSHVST